MGSREQLCKEWLLKNIIPSAARTTAIGKYLVALSKSFAKIATQDDPKENSGAVPSGRRRQLHILYLLNDLFHHTKYHIESSCLSSILAENFQSYIVELLGAATAYSSDVYVKQHKHIKDLLDIWEEKSYFQSSFIRRLRDADSETPKTIKAGYGKRDAEPKSTEECLSEEKKEAPYVLPSFHGDPSTPYYDLPAGNMMPHIIPNSLKPVNSHSVKALQLSGGPADGNLIVAMKDFLKDVELLDEYCFDDRADDMDIDELGQSVLGDEFAGNTLDGEGYYGWSSAFCRKMKNKVGFGDMSRVVRRLGSSDRSLSPRKKRKHSDSGSSRSWNSTVDKGRSRSSSNKDLRRRNGQRSSSRPRDLSKEQTRHRSRSRSLSYSPPEPVPIVQRSISIASVHPMQQLQAQSISTPPSIPFSYSFSKGFPLGPGSVPIPPPPPPNYHGPWPPPPPIQTRNNGNFAAPPLEPRVGQKYNTPISNQVPRSSLEGQRPQDLGHWGQQQFGHLSDYIDGERGGTQHSFAENVHDHSGRAHGRG